MSDEILKAVFTADTTGFDKGAQAVEKGAQKTEQAMEAAAQSAASASSKISASMQAAGDGASKAADTVQKRFSNLFGDGQLPAQKAADAVQTVTKAVEANGATLATGQKAQAAWGETVAASVAKVRDTVVTSFSAMGKAAKTGGEVVMAAGGVIGAAQNSIVQALARSNVAANAASSVQQAAATVVTGAWVAAAATIALSLRNALAEASQITSTAQITGVTTDSLQRLKFAAEQTGGSFAGITAAIKSYAETVNEIATNPTAKAAQALNLMGVSLRDSSGAVKDFNTLLLDVADKFKTYENGAQKAALAQAIFKGSADQLIPLLNRGSDGIRALGDEAAKTGAVWGPEMVAKIADADKEMKKFTSSVTRLGAELAFLLTPLAKAADGITWLAQKLKEGFATATDPIKQTEFAIASVEAALASVKANGPADINALFGATTESEVARLEQKLIDLRAQLAQLKAEAGEGPGRLKGTIEYDVSKGGDQKAPDLNTLKDQKDQLDDYIAKLNGLPVLMGESFAFDCKPFEEAMNRVNEAERARAITAREATRIRLQLKRQEQDAILDTASLAASTITSVFANNKAAAIGAAVINTAVGVTKALSGSVPPFNFIQAGLVAAAGAAQIASISAASESGGGSVAPVSGGGASQNAGNEAPQAANNSTLFVQNINPNAFYSGDMVESLAGKLLQFQADGGKVVFDRG